MTIHPSAALGGLANLVVDRRLQQTELQPAGRHLTDLTLADARGVQADDSLRTTTLLLSCVLSSCQTRVPGTNSFCCCLCGYCWCCCCCCCCCRAPSSQPRQSLGHIFLHCPNRGFLHAKFWSATIPLSVRELAEAFLGTQCARIPGTCGTARASCCDGKVLLQLIWKAWVDCTGGQTNPVVRSSAMLSTKQAYKHVKHPTLKLSEAADLTAADDDLSCLRRRPSSASCSSRVVSSTCSDRRLPCLQLWTYLLEFSGFNQEIR